MHSDVARSRAPRNPARFQALLVALALTTAFGGVSYAQATQAPGGERLSAVLAVPIPGATLAAATGLVLTGEIPGIAVSLESPPGMRPVVFQKIIADLNASPITLFAERDYRLAAPEFEGCVLQGPVGVQQCTVGFVSGNPGLGCIAGGWLPTLGAGPVQAAMTLSHPIVAVIDSGIDPNLPAFTNHLFSLGLDLVGSEAGAFDVLDGLDNDKDGLIDEAYGHGTHVATTILEVAPDALIQPYRVVDADGIGWGFDVAEAILQATLDGVDMINLSLAMSEPTQLVSLTLAYAMVNRISVFAAAGNTGGPLVLFPSSFKGMPTDLIQVPADMPRAVISVTAVDFEQKLLPFSGYGPNVDLSAPGFRICASVPGGQTVSWSGTSMATAVATGVAALVRCKQPVGFDKPMGEILCNSASSLDAENPDFTGQIGAGLLNPLEAARLAR